MNHKGKQAAFGLILWFLLSTFLFSFPPKLQDKKKARVVPNSDLAASSLYRLFFGNGYRDLWTSEIEVEYLDLNTFAGGLTPVGTGKGMQSLGLRFVGADGRPYSFRPLQKSLLELLPEYTLDTFIRDVVEDQLKSAFPTAPPVVPVLLDALGILHNNPRIIIIPDDPKLGEYREAFTGKLGTIEEWPNEGNDGAPGFAGATEVHSTDELCEVLRSDPSQQVDAHKFLVARLFDLLIGDWDRHRGQWRWANVGDGFPPKWVPIPEDRDQAFARYDGIFLGLSRPYFPQLTNFGPNFNTILGMTWNGRTVDRHFLVGLSKNDWDKAVRTVQSKLSDSVIDQAMQNLPPAHYGIAAEKTAAVLKIRRDKLPKIAEEYFRHLADEVDIHATDFGEEVDIIRLQDGSLEVLIFANEEGKIAARPYFSRRFYPKDTQDVRIFLHAGANAVTIKGQGRDAIDLRIICSHGQDSIKDTSRFKGTRVYDARRKGSAAVQGVLVDQRPYTVPETSSLIKPARDWGERSLWTGLLYYNSDLGMLTRIGYGRQRFGFRRDPYADSWSVKLAYATRLQNFRLDTDYKYTWENSPLTGRLAFMASGIETLYFNGFGNNSPVPEDGLSADVRRQAVRFEPTLDFFLSQYMRLEIGLLFEYSRTAENPGTVVARDLPVGSGDLWQGGFTGRFVMDTLDSHGWPTRGAFIKIEGSYYPKLLDKNIGDYGTLDTALAGVLNLSPDFVLSGRFGAKKVWGSYPYFQAAYLGGSENLRGYTKQRFAGDAAVYSNLEVRFPISRYFVILPGEFGLYAFLDTGRIFLRNETSDKWHYGYGGGIWIAPLVRQLTMSFALGQSEEGMRVYFRFGFDF